MIPGQPGQCKKEICTHRSLIKKEEHPLSPLLAQTKARALLLTNHSTRPTAPTESGGRGSFVLCCQDILVKLVSQPLRIPLVEGKQVLQVEKFIHIQVGRKQSDTAIGEPGNGPGNRNGKGGRSFQEVDGELHRIVNSKLAVGLEERSQIAHVPDLSEGCPVIVLDEGRGLEFYASIFSPFGTANRSDFNLIHTAPFS